MSSIKLADTISDILTELDVLKDTLVRSSSSASDLNDEDCRVLGPLLEALILRRVEVLPSFELLLTVDPGRGSSLLLRRYLGQGVNVDGKFGGYEFELATMLDDLVELGPTMSLDALVQSDQFDLGKLQDPRVRRAFAEALSLEPTEVQDWVEGRRKGESD